MYNLFAAILFLNIILFLTHKKSLSIDIRPMLRDFYAYKAFRQ